MFGKIINKTKNGIKEAFRGDDGSVFDIIGKTFLFFKELIAAINESIQARRNRIDKDE